MISVVIPVYNEEEVLPELCRRLTPVLAGFDEPYEVIFINDGSRDQSLEVMKELHAKDTHIKFIDFSRNFGQQIAVTAGLDYASGDAVIIMDADLQDPPEVLSKMIEKWQEGYDVVYAVREKRKGETFFKRFTSKWFYRIIRRLTNIDIPIDTGDFRLMSRRALDSLNRMREDNRFIRGMVSWIGFRQIGVLFERDARFAGETKYPFKKMLKIALDGIFSFSKIGLEISSYLGFLVSTFSFLYIIFIVVAFSLGKTVPGYASIMAAILFFSGVQLITIGMLGEYIGRIYDEVKDRPLYIVQNSGGFEEANKNQSDEKEL